MVLKQNTFLKYIKQLINRRLHLLFACFIFLLCLNASAQDLSNLGTAKPVTLSGSFGTNLAFYNVSGIDARQDPFSYGITANATLSVYSISMPFTFTYFNNNSKFTQPFNQFGISPSYKWTTGHFGYRSINFSEFTLNGQTFLGAGVELNPGKLRFGMLYGKFNKNSEFDPYMADSVPDYIRKGWAMKIGYGTNENFVDFTMLRIGDNTDNYIKPTDTLNTNTPQQNMAYGLSSKISFIKNLSLMMEGAISFYTNDRKAQRLNSIDNSWLIFSNNFMTINQTSEYFTAFKSALVYKFTDKISTGMEYKRIAPGYRTMGAYFFSNDLSSFTLNQTYTFLQNKIITKGSIGFQHDNLDNTKKSTSKRTVGSLIATYNINDKFGIDASYSNFTTNQKAGRLAIIDSLKLYQTNHTISITPRFMKVTTTRSHVVMLNFNYMKLDDKNKKTASQTETATTIMYLNYILGFIPQKMNLTFGLNYTGLKNNLYKNTMNGFTSGVSKTMAQDKLSVTWSNSLLFNKINDDSGTIFNTSVTTSFHFAPKHTFNFNIYYISNSFGEKSATPSYNETRGDISYVFTF